jgi:hypothetical protein
MSIGSPFPGDEPLELRPLSSSVYRLSSLNDNSATSVAKVSNFINHSRPPSFRVGKMVDIRHWIFGSIDGIRWTLYEFGA